MASKTGSSRVPPESDVFILIIGSTGAGKSTFINEAAGETCVAVGHGLQPATTAIQTVSVTHPDNGLRVVLIDTPGFDDISDAPQISDWLVEKYKRGTKLAGIIYLHQISRARVSGPSLKSYRMFTKLCADVAMTNVILVTTMWAAIALEVGEKREEQLTTGIWKEMLDKGAITARFMHTHKSAWDIVHLLVQKERIRAPLIHQQPINPSPLDARRTHTMTHLRNKDPSKGPLESDVLILIMGPTGSGKSAFINKAADTERVAVGHRLLSCTTEIQTVSVTHSDNHHRIVFIDTPGFDDSLVDDVVILEKIADWLVTTFKEEKKLAGILYLHEISQARMRGSFVKNYAMFTKLCGDDAMKNVVLVTTKWAGISEELGKSREDELKTEFWKETLDKGAVTARFMHTHKSAWEIVDQLVPKERLRALLIQHQLVELKRSLPETAAGKTLRKHLQDALKEYEQTVEQRRKAVVAQKNGLDSPSPELQAEYEEAQKRYEEARTRLRSLLKQIEQLKIPIGKRIRAFFGFI